VLGAPAGSALATPLSCASASVGSTCQAATEPDLTAILQTVDQAYDNYTLGIEENTNPAPTMPATTTIDLTQNIQLTSDLPFVNGPVVIDGQTHSLTSVENGSGVPEYRGFLLYNSLYEAQDCAAGFQLGTCDYAPGADIPVTIENLTIANTAANGGNGGDGAGGGPGLGGAIFVGNGVDVTLSGDSFADNSATGGNGGAVNDPNFPTNHGLTVGGGGGGGMGGAGASGQGTYSGGGGGLGAGATGGDGSGSAAGASGIAYGLENGGFGDHGYTNCTTTPGANSGGANGGGGGGGGSAGSAAGGGGLSGGGDNPGEGVDGNSCGDAAGGAGIGGGGGGSSLQGGDSVWGGGQGFPDMNNTRNGFGGGAAGSTNEAGNGTGAGFAAGNGTNNAVNGDATTSTTWAGGGGAGLGGAVFVQMGAMVTVSGTLSQGGATVAGGAGGCSGPTCGGNGSGYGSAIFLQGDGDTINRWLGGTQPVSTPSGSSLTFNPAAGQTQTIGNNVADENSYNNDGGLLTPWTLVLNGAGTLDLAGHDQFGNAELNKGTLVVPNGASLTSSVTIKSGAELVLAGTVTGNVTLDAGGLLCAAQAPSNFTNNGGSVEPLTSCSTPPTVVISSPAGGGNYSVNQAVSTAFTCAAGTNSVVSSCVDSRGTSGSSGTLDTSTAGVHTYTVTATDTDGKTATASITYTVISPCHASPLTFGLVSISVPTGGCLLPSADGDSFSTPGPLTINGLTLPALPAGAQYIASEPTTANPGGSLAVQAPSVNVSVPINIGGTSGVTFNVPAFTWNLPAAPAGGVGSATVKTLTMDPTETLKGMKVGGSVAMNLGKDGSGNYYTSFVFTVDLPNMFKSGPAGNSAGLTGTASVRVDAQGAHFNGLAVQVSNAYIGTLQVKSACFAYLPAGSSGGPSACPAPAVPATPLPALTCTNAGGDNWSGSADIVLPSPGGPELSLYGDVAGGSLNALSAQASNLKIALADDVFLTSVGVSLCLPNATEPFEVQGTVTLGGIAQADGSYLVNVNGAFGYRDPWQGQPWAMDIGGEVSVKGTTVGQGSVDFNGSNYLYFEVGSQISWAKVASVSGYIEGWLETQSPYNFNVQGSVSLDITDIGSFTGTAAVSTKGVAACATVGGISYWEPEKDSDWVWYEPWKIHWVEQTVTWQAGVGYYWGASTASVWPASCDIGNYELATPDGVQASAAGHAAAAATSGFKVQDAHAPMSVRINGAGGAPVFKLKTPSGHVILPPAAGKVGEKVPGYGMLFENKAQHNTTVLLTSPAKGAWHVIPVSGSPRVTSIQTAKIVPPPEVVGAAKPLAGGKVGLGVAYSLAAGEKMTLYASGPHHSQQVIGVVKGKSCPGRHSGPSSQLCAHVRFRPTYGPSGKRTIYASIINSKRLPVATVKLATIRLRFARPAATKPVLLRKGTTVKTEWLPVADAAKYAVSVVLTDGRKLAYTTSKVSVSTTNVAKTEVVKATVYPVMPDGVIGKSAATTLKAGASRSAKPKHKTKRKHH
jgi:hypothetical protein